MRESVRQVLSLYRPRNAKLVDPWSFVHLASCAAAALVVGPVLTFVLALLWEPIEIRVLSPFLAKRGIDFGHESLANSLSDIAFNGAGVVVAVAIIGWTGHQPPFAPL